MGKHRKPAAKKWGPYVTTGIALEAVTLFAFTYATDSHVTLNPLLSATTSIFVDGTKSITGTEQGVSPYRMADSFQGAYDQTPGVVDTDSSGNNKFVTYPRSLGPLTGIGDPTYDASEADATAKTVQAVRNAKNDPDYHPGDTIYVVGYSQGAGAVANAIPELETDEFAGDNIQYVLAANPRRNDGGILTRVPAGVYLPIFGVTFGGGTTPQDPNAKVLQVTKQYDGVGDAPRYVFNVVADANAILGYYYLHPGYYQTVNPSTDPSLDDRIVTTSADGTITDVLIKAPVGQLPLTMPLLQLGVPQSVVTALDPFLRAVIETGYSRPGPNSYPTQPVPFALAPPPTQWLSDLQSVAAGAAQTGQALAGTAPSPNLVVPNVVVPTEVANLRTASVQQKLAPDAGLDVQPPPDPPARDVNTQPVSSDSTGSTSSPHKFAPPPHAKDGWKPGDLLRAVFAPKPAAGQSSPGDTSTPSTVPSTTSTQNSSGATDDSSHASATAGTS